MAKETKQQSSLKKLLIIGVPLVLIIALFPSGGGDTKKGPSKTQLAFAAQQSKTKKVDSLDLQEDHDAKFQAVEASMKDSFVPLVTKKSAGGKGVLPGTIDPAFTDGEPNWVYTGNMTVNGVPNALLENTVSGEGVFLRPGQKWKSLRLVTVREDSIELEGPNNSHKTIYDELAMVPTEVSAALPPAAPAAANPADNGGGRRRRGNNQFNGQMADGSGLSGPIGGPSGVNGFTDQSGQ